jgi:hypothetical protein
LFESVDEDQAAIRGDAVVAQIKLMREHTEQKTVRKRQTKQEAD